MRDLTTIRLPEPPSWLTDLPVVGIGLDEQWREAMVDLPASLAQLQPYIGTAAGYGLSFGAGLGFAIIEFLIAIVIAAILLVTGEAGVQVLRRFVARIGGVHHLSLLDVAAQTIRGVAAGIIFTAFLQAAAAGVRPASSWARPVRSCWASSPSSCSSCSCRTGWSGCRW